MIQFAKTGTHVLKTMIHLIFVYLLAYSLPGYADISVNSNHNNSSESCAGPTIQCGVCQNSQQNCEVVACDGSLSSFTQACISQPTSCMGSVSCSDCANGRQTCLVKDCHGNQTNFFQQSCQEATTTCGGCSRYTCKNSAKDSGFTYCYTAYSTIDSNSSALKCAQCIIPPSTAYPNDCSTLQDNDPQCQVQSTPTTLLPPPPVTVDPNPFPPPQCQNMVVPAGCSCSNGVVSCPAFPSGSACPVIQCGVCDAYSGEQTCETIACNGHAQSYTLPCSSGQSCPAILNCSQCIGGQQSCETIDCHGNIKASFTQGCDVFIHFIVSFYV